jgi:hypothetical protein
LSFGKHIWSHLTQRRHICYVDCYITVGWVGVCCYFLVTCKASNKPINTNVMWSSDAVHKWIFHSSNLSLSFLFFQSFQVCVQVQCLHLSSVNSIWHMLNKSKEEITNKWKRITIL